MGFKPGSKRLNVREETTTSTNLTAPKLTQGLVVFFLFQVLDSGELLEFDQPHALLQRPEGMLSKLVEQTGKTEAAQLIEIAKKHFKQRRISGADGHVTFASPEELTVDG